MGCLRWYSVQANCQERLEIFDFSNTTTETKEKHMLEENEYLLVMTSCINPSGSSANVVRADPLVRLEDYKRV
jgi:hypothetical protein